MDSLTDLFEQMDEGSVFAPSEAEASPIGRAFKAGSKALGSLSDSTKRLAGKTVDGKIIKEVRHGHGNWRDIIFDDGSGQAVTKDYINTLCRALGTEGKLAELTEKTQEGQLQQAIKSMGMHENLARKAYPNTASYAEAQQRAYLKKAGEIAPESVPDSVSVSRNGLNYIMPRKYAEILQRNGILKITKKASIKPYPKLKGEK